MDLAKTVDERLAEHLTPEGRQWLADATGKVQADPKALAGLFPAAGRRCGRGPLADGWTIDDAARTLLLLALPLTGADLAGEVEAAYRYGDANERRGVLRALDALDTDRDLGPRALPIVLDALRTNDTRLVAAALGPYGATHLDDAMYRQGVLKCVFVGIPLADIAGLDRRADPELARMLADYAREREAAGRDVPADILPYLEGAS